MSTISDARTLTQAELVAEARVRFGEDPLDWAFICPSCGDVANGRDFRAALKEHPRTNVRTNDAVTASDIVGQECIGRTLGALGKRGEYTGRGCDWAAYGLFSGPWFVVLTDDRKAPCFALAEGGGVDA